MKHQETNYQETHRRPRNRATMDEPQEEFIEADSSHAQHDREHGDELKHASHASVWQVGERAA